MKFYANCFKSFLNLEFIHTGVYRHYLHPAKLIHTVHTLYNLKIEENI